MCTIRYWNVTTRSLLALFLGASLLPAPLFSREDPPPPASPSTGAADPLLHRVIEKQKENDRALFLYERIERLEKRKTAADPLPYEVKIVRVVPAGTGAAHIPVNAEGQPQNLSVYRSELEKLLKSLTWAADTGRAQHDAYEKIARKQKERDDLIDATRDAFLFTFLAREPRGERMLTKYRMEPNPAFRPTSRFTSIYPKVRGFVWVDEAAGQLARLEGEVTEDISVGLFLGKIYKGSHFFQERFEVAPGLWLPGYSQYDFDGRKLFSTFSVHERTYVTNYRRIGPPAEAVLAIRAELASSTSSLHP